MNEVQYKMSRSCYFYSNLFVDHSFGQVCAFGMLEPEIEILLNALGALKCLLDLYLSNLSCPNGH